MNSRGVFITFMVFLLAAAVLLLHSSTKEIGSRQEEALVNEAAFDTVNNAFNNFFEEVVNLNKEGFAREVQQRPMPFEYDLNGSTIVVSQRLPPRSSLLDSYVDMLNIYSIFANLEEETGNLRAVTKVFAQNEEWNAGSPAVPDLNYAILPQCLFYDLNGDSHLVLRAGILPEWGCTQSFDYADVTGLDVNIFFDSSDYTYAGTLLSCSGEFDDGGACSEAGFDSGNPDPYIVVRLDEECDQSQGCKVTTQALLSRNQKVISAQFDPAQEKGSVLIQATDNYVVEIRIGWVGEEHRFFPMHIENQFTDEPIHVDLNISFDDKIQGFYFTGFGISVMKRNFSAKRHTWRS